MERKYLKLKENEELVIFDNKYNAFLIKKKDKKFITSEIENRKLENIYIKRVTSLEITSFILTLLLENSYINLNNSRNLINELLDNHYNYFKGNSNKKIKDMYFECITEYEN